MKVPYDKLSSRAKSQFKPIIVTHIESGEERFFESIKGAKEVLNIDFRSIIQGHRNLIKGYTAKLA